MRTNQNLITGVGLPVLPGGGDLNIVLKTASSFFETAFILSFSIFLKNWIRSSAVIQSFAFEIYSNKFWISSSLNGPPIILAAD